MLLIAKIKVSCEFEITEGSWKTFINKEKKKIIVTKNQIKIADYEFDLPQKIGVTVPLFKKETTMVFEAKFNQYFAHVHVTTKDENYLEIFNRLMAWKNSHFPE